MMNETTNVSNFSQLAIAVMYADGNEAVEKFLGFTNVSDDFASMDIY